MVAMRLYVVAFVNLVSIRSYQVRWLGGWACWLRALLWRQACALSSLFLSPSRAAPTHHPLPRTPALQAHLPLERLQQWITFWMLTGAESLCVTSLGFPVRLLASCHLAPGGALRSLQPHTRRRCGACALQGAAKPTETDPPPALPLPPCRSACSCTCRCSLRPWASPLGTFLACAQT